MAEIEKLDLTSMDIKEHQLEKLKELFPEAFTEGNKIDWDRLRRTLGEQIDAGKERYGMNWPGKAECIKTTIQRILIHTWPIPDRWTRKAASSLPTPKQMAASTASG